ncbi:unnamed protein product [Discosporangium mesarthrocarpum]
MAMYLRAIISLLCVSSALAFVAPSIVRPPPTQHVCGGRASLVNRRPVGMSVATQPFEEMSAGLTPAAEIEPIQSHDDFLEAMACSQNELVVVNFFDKFCRACDEINDRYEKLAMNHGHHASFFRVEFSRNRELCKQLGIQRLPTVQIYAGGLGRVRDMPAGPSRFHQVEKAMEELSNDAEVSAVLGASQSS